MRLFLSQRRLFALLLFTLLFLVLILKMDFSLKGDHINDKIYYALEEQNKTFYRSRDSKSNNSRNIGILTVIDETVKERDYFFALESMRCYASLQAYDFRIEKDSATWSALCNQTDIMFRRHCIAAHLLDDHEWTLVIDADVGVINPSKLIEEWIDDRFDVIMYDRFYNWEVATGSYLVRRSQFGKEFLMQFAEYEKKLPKSFHGTDNSAIHALLVDLFAPYAKQEMSDCHIIWEQSKSYSEVFQFEACVRIILGSNRHFPPKLKIVPKGEGWVRDGWLSDSLWSPETDFMLHGWQLRRLLTPFLNETRYLQFASWEAPFSRPIDQTQCQLGTSTWHYNRALIKTRKIIEEKLETVRRKVISHFWNTTAEIGRYFKYYAKPRKINSS